METKCKFSAQNAGTMTKDCLRPAIVPISTSGSQHRYGFGYTGSAWLPSLVGGVLVALVHKSLDSKKVGGSVNPIHK